MRDQQTSRVSPEQENKNRSQGSVSPPRMFSPKQGERDQRQSRREDDHGRDPHDLRLQNLPHQRVPKLGGYVSHRGMPANALWKDLRLRFVIFRDSFNLVSGQPSCNIAHLFADIIMAGA